MSLRLQYSLRQALAVVLFGLPLPLLEQILARTISSEEVEFLGSVTIWFTVPILFPLSTVTFMLAYERFEEEFEPRRECTNLVRRGVCGLVLLLVIGAIAMGSAGWPTNEYQWARQGIIAAGLYLGWLMAKWVFFDWIERVRENPRPPGKPPFPVQRRPVSS